MYDSTRFDLIIGENHVADPSRGFRFGKVKRIFGAALTSIMFAIVCNSGISLQAQTAYFSGVTTTIDSVGLPDPFGIAVDSSGNLYVADASLQTVFKITPTGPGTYSAPVALVAGTPLYYPVGVAVDASGNVWVADEGCPGCTPLGQVYEIINGTPSPVGSAWQHPFAITADGGGNVFVTDLGPAGTGTVSKISGGVVTALSSTSFNDPYGIAVDTNDNLYVIDGGSIKKLASPGYSTSVTTGAPSSFPTGLSIDPSGNLWLTEESSGRVEEMLASTNYGTVETRGNGFTFPLAVSSDGNGNIFVTDFGGMAVKQISTGGINFGSSAIGTTLASSPLSIPFTFTTAGTVQAPVVLTQGAPSLDFSDAGSGTCTSNGTSHSYSPGDTCTVAVQFAATVPGLRLGGVQLEDSSGNPIATARIYGTGVGPQVVFPGNSTPAVVGSGFNRPYGVAVDAAGDVFVGDILGPAVEEIVAVGGKVTSSSTVVAVGSGFDPPTGVAVDGSGDVFVADAEHNAVKEIVAVNGHVSSSSTVNTVGSGFSDPSGVAVDANGDVFVADSFNNAVKEIVAVNGLVSSSSSVITVGSGFSDPAGVAVDASGDVFVADIGSSAVKEIVAVNGQVSSSSAVNTVGSGFSDPFSVAVDASGDVFVADLGNQAVKEIVAVNGLVSASSTVNTVGSGFIGPYGVALDAAGNVFVADLLGHAVKEIPLATPPTIAFPAVTKVGTQDIVDGPHSATVANNGNAPLTFNLPTTGDNPGLSTSNFTWDDLLATCTQTTPSSSTAFTLAEGASCTVAVEFTPTATGALTDNLSLTDNSLNATAATQEIPLSGTAVDITMTPAANTALPPGTVGTVYSGQTFAASGGSGTYTYSATGLPAGLTLDPSLGVLSGTPTAVANSASVTVTATDSSSSVQISQTYTITIAQGTVTLNWTPPSSITYGDNLLTVLTAMASVGSTTEPLSFGSATYTASLNPSGTPVTVTNSTVLDVGTYTLTLSYTPSDTTDYTTPAPVQQTLIVNQATATISIGNLPASPVFNGSFAPAYTYSGNGTPTESVSSTTLSVCTVTGGTVNFVGVGTCTLTAAATATTDYLATTGSQQSVTVNQATATISIDNLPASPVYNGSFAPAYTYSGNGTPTESVSSSTLTVCTVTGGTVNFVGVGTCTLTAAATATTDYLAATGSQQSVTVNQATATISIDNLPASPVYNGGFAPAYTYSGNGSPTESVSSSTLTVCTVTSGTVNFVGVGTCTLTAAATATTDYLAATGAQQSVTVNQATATISIDNLPASPVYNGSFTPAYTYSGNGTPTESVSSSTLTVCTVTGGTVNFVGVGTCTLTAAATATTDYLAATGSQQSVTVNQATATISIDNLPASPVYNGSFTPAYTYSGNGTPTESVSSTTLSVCAVTGGTVNFVGVGTCTLTAAATATTDYLAATGTEQSFTVNQATQTITFTPPSSPVIFGVSPITLSATSISGGTVTFNIDPSSTAAGSISGNTLTITGAGTLVIDANQDGNTNYQAAAQVQQTILVNPAAQIITFTPPASPVTYGVAPVTLSAGTTSGLTVMFTIDPSSTATGNIAGNTLTITSAGTLVIDANQSGNVDYQAAAQVQNTIVVNPANYVVTASSDDPGTASHCTPQTTSGQGTNASCSLRDALLEAAATGGGNITFDSTNFGGPTTIFLTKGVLGIPSATTIAGATTGSGATLTNLVTVDGNNASGIFRVSSGVTGASIANLTIQHSDNAGIQNAGALALTGDSITSNTNTSGTEGGGIDNNGTLTLSASTISGNTAGNFGGGIANTGTLTMSDDTVTGNSASSSGGGIYNSATLVVSDSTLSANTAGLPSGGGGIDNMGSGTAALANVIVSGNTSNGAADDFDGSPAYTDSGGNIIGVVNGTTVNATAIDLAPLDSYGGPTSNADSAAGQPGDLRGSCCRHSFGAHHGRARPAQHQHELSKLPNLRRCRCGPDQLRDQLLHRAF